MSEEIKNVEELAVAEPEEKVSFASKIKAGFKKHGKKVAVGAAIGTAAIIGFVLGHKGIDSEDYEDWDSEDDSCEEIESDEE